MEYKQGLVCVHQNFVIGRLKRIMLEKPAAWTRDGEDGGIHQDVYITNHREGVEIIV